jgi:hypothetical protein
MTVCSSSQLILAELKKKKKVKSKLLNRMVYTLKLENLNTQFCFAFVFRETHCLYVGVQDVRNGLWLAILKCNIH